MKNLPVVPSLALIVVAGLFAFPAIGQHAGEHAAQPTIPRGNQPTQASAEGHADHAAPAAAPSDSHQDDTATAQQGPNAPQDHAGHAMPMEKSATKAEDLPVGHDPAPAPINLGMADTIFGASSMGMARGVLAREHGGELLWKLMTDQAEYRTGPGGAGYGWDAEAWFGGDLDRLVIKSEGQGSERSGLEEGEVQALYSRAIAPYTDIQLGLRQDIDSTSATYAVLGVEAILPYWLKAEGALFVSNDGAAFARLEGTYDLMLTQRVVLQPNLELNFSMQNVPAALKGSGLSELTAGLRIRYDVTRQFSPYIGVNFERKLGGTAAMHRAAGEGVEATSFVVGIRAFL